MASAPRNPPPLPPSGQSQPGARPGERAALEPPRSLPPNAPRRVGENVSQALKDHITEMALGLLEEQMQARIVHYQADLETNPELDAITAQVVAQLKEIQASAGAAERGTANRDAIRDAHEKILRALLERVFRPGRPLAARRAAAQGDPQEPRAPLLPVRAPREDARAGRRAEGHPARRAGDLLPARPLREPARDRARRLRLRVRRGRGSGRSSCSRRSRRTCRTPSCRADRASSSASSRCSTPCSSTSSACSLAPSLGELAARGHA